MARYKYLTRLSDVHQMDEDQKRLLGEVCEKYAFRASEYYLSLIDWGDPRDPIRRIVIPTVEELDGWGRLDASDEVSYTRVPGLEHKYKDTALLLVNDVCGGFCRFCFRKRLFMNDNDEVARDLSAGFEYIKKHEEIINVLLTGGDPLILSSSRLEGIVARLREIDHVKVIRIGTKMPAFNPSRIVDDPEVLQIFRRYSVEGRRIYVMVHFNHPRELTHEALMATTMIQEAGGILANQTPIVRGVNDDPMVLASLLKGLSAAGIPPYYIFVGRQTSGNRGFAVPVERCFDIYEEARRVCSGLEKRGRLVMSHASGKIEIIGKTDKYVYFRYHRAARPQKKPRFFAFKRNPKAFWFDDYAEVGLKERRERKYRCLGPD